MFVLSLFHKWGVRVVLNRNPACSRSAENAQYFFHNFLKISLGDQIAADPAQECERATRDLVAGSENFVPESPVF
jgi:hypothetical protein